MRPVPLTSDEQIAAVEHAINVHADHYRDTKQEYAARKLDTAADIVTTSEYIPGNAVSFVWDILIEHDHLRAAMKSNYNDGVDGPPLLEAVTNIVAVNGDHLYESYSDHRERLGATE